jgi:hypothetical protein
MSVAAQNWKFTADQGGVWLDAISNEYNFMPSSTVPPEFIITLFPSFDWMTNPASQSL